MPVRKKSKSISSRSNSVKSGPSDLTASFFVKKLESYRSAIERKKYHRYFKFDDKPKKGEDTFIGVKMGQVFTYLGMVKK